MLHPQGPPNVLSSIPVCQDSLSPLGPPGSCGPKGRAAYMAAWTNAEPSLVLKVKSLSRVRLFATPWTVACQAPSSVEFSRQEYWSGLPFPSISLPFPEDLPDLGIEPRSATLQADSLPSEPSGKCIPWKVQWKHG